MKDNYVIKDLFISVVVATYKREEVLCQTLKALFDQDYPSYEIIVVDQTRFHTEQTEHFLRENRNNLRYIKVAHPSLPNARNVGIQHAQGDIILFVDDDVIIDKSFLSAHASAYDNPIIGGVAGRVVLSDETPKYSSDIIARMETDKRDKLNFSSTIRGYIDQAQGCNMSFLRQALINVGLFESCFRGNAFLEETDTCFRIRRAGYQVLFEPNASLIHLGEAAGGCNNRTRGPRWYYWVLHNTFLFALRHHSLRRFPNIVRDRVDDILKTDPLLLVLIPFALPHTFISYLRARSSLHHPKELTA